MNRSMYFTVLVLNRKSYLVIFIVNSAIYNIGEFEMRVMVKIKMNNEKSENKSMVNL